MTRGFTLIELLVVVLIIGILAAVAVPQYQKAVLRAQFVQMVVNIDAIGKAQKVYFMENGTYATTLDELSLQINNPSGILCSALDNQYSSICGLYKRHKQFVVLQENFKNNLLICCSYPDTNYEGDSLCATEMQTSSWYNGCGERGCHCYWRQK